MWIIVNGTPRETHARTLLELVREMEVDAFRVATAVNGEFAPRNARSSVQLTAGDHVEILSPMQGG